MDSSKISNSGEGDAPVDSGASVVDGQGGGGVEASANGAGQSVEVTPRKKSRKPLIIAIIIIAVVLIVGVVVAVILLNQPKPTESGEQEAESDTVAVSTGDNAIDLTGRDEDYRITAAGEYTITGTLTGHSVLVEAEDAVTLVLNNVTINSDTTAAIANTGSHALNITLADGSTNNLSDGGKSDYDAALYSAGSLTINGNTGVLNVTGQQEEGEGIATDNADLTIDGGVINVKSADDGLNAGGNGGTITINGGTVTILAGGDGIDSNKNAVFNGGTVYVAGSSAGGDAGIDTDDGYEIHGGTIVALGSDMLESPEVGSTQYAVAIMLDNTYNNGANIQLLDAAGTTVLEYTANENFRTLVLSNDKLTAGAYNLAINNQTVQSFNISSVVTVVGEVGGAGGGMPGGR